VYLYGGFTEFIDQDPAGGLEYSIYFITNADFPTPPGVEGKPIIFYSKTNGDPVVFYTRPSGNPVVFYGGR